MTEIRFTNSKTRRKEIFQPINPENVRMYVCGPTVYDRAHLGNARPVVVFDTLFRLLNHVYGADQVTYVRNFTDIDDKINARSASTGRPIGDITEETIGWYLSDMAALGALEPTEMPRATGFIPQMIAMTADLIEKGHAYAAEGHVLFAVESYADYGKLSGRSVDDMIAGARVEAALQRLLVASTKGVGSRQPRREAPARRPVSMEALAVEGDSSRVEILGKGPFIGGHGP